MREGVGWRGWRGMVLVPAAADCYGMKYGWRVLGAPCEIVVVRRLLRGRRNWAPGWDIERTQVLRHNSPV